METVSMKLEKFEKGHFRTIYEETDDFTKIYAALADDLIASKFMKKEGNVHKVEREVLGDGEFQKITVYYRNKHRMVYCVFN